jgi:hypothetical protein
VRAILVLALSVENIQVMRAPFWFRWTCQAPISATRREAISAFDVAVETLAFERAELDLNHVEPADMLGGVVEFKPPEHAGQIPESPLRPFATLRLRY